MRPLNPYALLTPPLLAGMLKQPLYFVRQYHPRGTVPGSIPLLFTYYAHQDSDRERAERHMRMLKNDRYRFLYDSMDPVHLERLHAAAGQPEGYRVYINLLPRKWKPGDLLKKKIASYMMHCLPGWRYSPADRLQITLKERYGELFLLLQWKGQQTEVHLDLVEKAGLHP